MKQVTEAIWNELLPFAPVFTTRQVAEAAEVDLSNASRDLRRLEGQGMITKVRRGLWAVPTHPDFSPYAVVPHLFRDEGMGYVSLLSALNLHGMIDQLPRTVQVVTTRQRADLDTAVGTFEFHQVDPDLFGGFGPYRRTGNFDIATPEKALFDILYLSVRKGRRFRHLPEIELPEGFSPETVEGWIERVSFGRLRRAVEARWKGLGEEPRSDAGRR